jgi:IclR family KDG regulon transcriptional repressor
MAGQEPARARARKSEAGEGTVERAIRLLECFAEAEEWPLNGLAQRLGLPLSTTHRLLQLCRQEGFVAAVGRGTYRPGLALYRLAGVLTHQFPLRRIAAPLLDRLAADFDETALLTLLDRPALKMFFAAKAEPSAPVRYVLETNRPGSLCWGATALSLLAYLTDQEIDTVIARNEPSPVDGRLFDPMELRSSLAEIQRTGFATSRGQRTPEGVAIAVPFFDAAGQVVGNIAVTTPAFRYKEANGLRILAALRPVAADISHALGGDQSPAIVGGAISASR